MIKQEMVDKFFMTVGQVVVGCVASKILVKVTDKVVAEPINKFIEKKRSQKEEA